MNLSKSTAKWPYRPAETGLIALGAAYVLLVAWVAHAIGASEQFSLLFYSSTVVKVTVMLFLFFVGWRVYSLILFERPAHLTRRLIEDVRSRLFTPAQIRAAIPVILVFMFFMSAFTSMKGMIPLLRPYEFDEVFNHMDRILHGGIDPWRWLYPIFGKPVATSAVNIVYNMWYVVMFGVLYWQLFDLRRPALRLRFFWAFFLCFIVNGSILAVLLSSAGPCYYHYLVDGYDPFAQQMEFLRNLAAQDYPVWAVATQDMLWNAYQANKSGFGSGISAMPSVHVSIACLFMFLAWEYGPRQRLFFTLFAILIMIGSVLLLWHYAIDGYLAGAVTYIIWIAVGRFLKEEK